MKIQIEESALDSMKVMVQRLQEECDTLRAQLDALQSGDELPELKPYPEISALNKRGAWNEWAQSYARQAQAMARAKLLVELEKVDCSSTGVCVRSGLYTRPLPAQDVNAELVRELEDARAELNLNRANDLPPSTALANAKAAQQK